MTSTGYANQRRRIGELESRVRQIQSQVGEVTTQSSETWHDNAPYSILVEELRVANTRLGEAHEYLQGYHIQEYPTTLDEPVVQYGTRVTMRMDDQPVSFSIVGFGDDDIDNGHILYTCPLAKVLMRKRKGDRFVAEVNRASHRFQIDGVFPLGKTEDDVKKR